MDLPGSAQCRVSRSQNCSPVFVAAMLGVRSPMSTRHLHAPMNRLHFHTGILPMKMRTLVFGIAAALVSAGCATRDPMPFATGMDCFYPACSIDVEIVDDGSGGGKLKLAGDGNIRMGTRHRLVAIVWKIRTPGYEFRGDSIRPHSGRLVEGRPATNLGEWEQQILPHPYFYDTYSVTDRNSERTTLVYDITVYPSAGTAGKPITLSRTIVNDSFQGREHGWLMMR
jgi:hypothetical protein